MTILSKMLTVLMLATPILAQGTNKPDWAERCETTGEKACYLVQNVFLDNNNQRLAGLALRRKGQDYVIMVSVPLGVDLTTGSQIKIDRQKALHVPYQVCNPQGCHGGQVLPHKLWRALSRARKLVVSYQDPTGRSIGVPFSLRGFYKSWRSLKATGSVSRRASRR